MHPNLWGVCPQSPTLHLEPSLCAGLITFMASGRTHLGSAKTMITAPACVWVLPVSYDPEIVISTQNRAGDML